MNKASYGIMALAVLAVCCFAFATGFESDATIDHDGDTDVFKISTTETFKINYVLDEADADKTLKFSAKVVNRAGETMASAVSPSTGTLTSGEDYTITVTVPSNPAKYTLVVEYLVADEKKSEDKFAFTAVNPIVLTVNLKADDVTLNLEDFGVYFYIDGEKMEDSYKTITMKSDGTGSVSYDWIADPVGEHRFCVKAVGDSGLITGLDEEHIFYAEDNDYSLVTALAFIVLILLLIYAVRVYRKPVKNFGKPKSRR